MKLFERVFGFLASLKLAVTLLLTLASVLAAGTMCESLYGTKVARFFLYDTLWFHLLLLCLGINIACAALSRYPWQRHHIGFVVTHIALLTILSGSFITSQWGIDGNLPLQEGESSQQFLLDEEELLITLPHDGYYQKIPVAFGFKSRAEEILHIDVGGGQSLTIDRFYPQAEAQRQVIPSEKGGLAAIEVRLFNDFADIKEWLLLDPHLEKTSVAVGPATVTLQRLGDEKTRENFLRDTVGRDNNELVIAVAHDGTLYSKMYSRKNAVAATPVRKIKLQEKNYTPWMNLQYELTQFYPKAELKTEYYPVSAQSKSESGQGAIRVVCKNAHGGQKMAWLGLGSTENFVLESQVIQVSYQLKTMPLPFKIDLHDFEMGLNPGETSPASYQSHVSVLEKGEKRDCTISMNEPLKASGFTLYQASYVLLDGGKAVSVLSVNRDPGRPVKYAGSIFLVLGIVLMFYFKPLFVQRWLDKGKNKK